MNPAKNGMFQSALYVKSTMCLIVLSILTAVTLDQPQAETQPIGIKVRFAVLYGDLKIGESIRTVVNGNDGYTYAEHRVQVGGLLRLLGEESYTQESTFQFHGTEVVPIQFKVMDESKNEVANGQFNWDDRTVVFGNGTTIDMPEHRILDWESWYVTMINSQTRDLESQRVTVVENNRVRTYEYQDVQPEQIDFQGETVDTIRIKLQDVNDGRRSYDVWISPQVLNLPLRIDKIKKSQRISFVARSFDWVYSK
ncbi:MAG: DUF3108 domain-containing protein [Acidiferrobacterales bacterium]|nr:DUF3108 domain-containing protein [Acidiferrobacterales bacterium]